MRINTAQEFLVLEAKAMSLAAHIHQAQTYGESAYTHHLYQVVSILKEFGFGEDYELLIAGWMHDIEDTAFSYSDVKELFGEEVADIVYAVTDERGKNRKERHEKTYPKIKANPKARVVKLADRIANIRWGLATDEAGKTQMYRKEHERFVLGVSPSNVDDLRELKMWDEIYSLLYGDSKNNLTSYEFIKNRFYSRGYE